MQMNEFVAHSLRENARRASKICIRVNEDGFSLENKTKQ